MPAFARDALETISAEIGSLVSARRAEQARLRSSSQLAAVIEVEHALAAAGTQGAIYTTIADGVRRLFPDVPTLLISHFDPASQLITAVAGFHEGAPMEVAGLPALPLAP